MAHTHTIDARGLLCPKPLVLLKAALADASWIGEGAILLDNATACENVERFLTDHHLQHTTQIEGNLRTIAFQKTEVLLGHKKTVARERRVVQLRSNRMGEGADDLGALLIQGFMNTLSTLSPLPETIVCYNSGIQLALRSSPVLEALKDLEKSGVAIYVCGTCLNFYSARDELAVGRVSNMADILEAMSSASLLISP